MKIKKYVMFGLAALSCSVTLASNQASASAHTWYDGTPSNTHGYWRTKSVFSKSLGISGHGALKVKAHSVYFTYTQSAGFYIKDTYWRKTGYLTYTIHGCQPADDNYDHRITIKKTSKNHAKVYIDGSSATVATPFPNSFYR